MHTGDIRAFEGSCAHSVVHFIKLLAAFLLLLVFAVVVAESVCVGLVAIILHIAAGEAAVLEHGEVETLGEVIGEVWEICKTVRDWFLAWSSWYRYF